MAAGFSPDKQVESYMYARVLGACLAYDNGNLSNGGWGDVGRRINQANAMSGNWFADPSAPLNGSLLVPGPYLDGINGLALDNGQIRCSTTLVNNALALWGGWSKDEALCAFGFQRADDAEAGAGRCTNTQGGTDEFERGGDVAGSYLKAVKSRVYGGKDISLSDEAKYLLYLKTFQKVCAASANVSTSPPVGSTSRDFAVRQASKTGQDVSIVTTYYTGRSNGEQGTKVSVSPSASLDPILGDLKTCGDLVNAINGKDGKNGLADAYAKWLSLGNDDVTGNGQDRDCQNGEATDSEGKPCTPVGDQSSCAIDGVGWILCPILTAGAGLADSAYGFLADNFLETDVSLVNTNPDATTADGQKIGTGTFTAWKIMQSIANVMFAIAVLVIIFSQLTSVGISNYGVKKLLPRIVVAAILVNLSFLICQIAVDVSNVLGYSLKSAFEGVASQVTAGGGGTAVSTSDESSNLAGITAAVLVVGSVAWVNIGAVIIAVVGAVVTLLMIFVLLIARKVLIVLLIVIAPLAFVAYLLPNTQPLFEKWRKMLTSLLLLFPVIGVLYGACLLASAIIKQIAGDDPVMKIAAYLALVIPLLAVIPLLRGSLDAAGKLGGAIQSLGQKGRGLAQNGTKQGMTSYKNSGLGRFRSAKAADRQARIAAGTFRGSNGNPLNWTRNARARANSRLNDSRAFNTVTGGFGADRNLAAQSQNRKDMQEAVAMFGNDDALASAWAQSGGETNHAAYAALSQPQKEQFSKMRDAGHHRKSTSYLAASQYLSENGKGSAATVQSALAHASAAGATSTDTNSARQAAIAAYRKSGRGDALADLSTAAGSPMTQQQGWGEVTASSVHREGIAAGSTGRLAYEAHLAANAENTRKALVGYDGMEARAQERANGAILAAAQRHEYNATGVAPTITTIQDAKTYFGVK